MRILAQAGHLSTACTCEEALLSLPRVRALRPSTTTSAAAAAATSSDDELVCVHDDRTAKAVPGSEQPGRWSTFQPPAARRAWEDGGEAAVEKRRRGGSWQWGEAKEGRYEEIWEI